MKVASGPSSSQRGSSWAAAARLNTESLAQVTGPYIDRRYQSQVRRHPAKGGVAQRPAKPVDLGRHRWVEQQSHPEAVPWAQRSGPRPSGARPFGVAEDYDPVVAYFDETTPHVEP